MGKREDKYHTPKDCTVDIGRMIQELEREQRMRKSVYPNLIKQGKLTSEVANHRWRCMKDAITCLERFNELFRPDQTNMFGSHQGRRKP